ncbi:MAG TPA: c-type cytochrome [Burkholderiales bacterium]|nr:c-type cytochrome [Burkholderiales bacterium]
MTRALLFAALLVPLAALAATDADISRLLRERGCALCHRAAPFQAEKEVPPVGPSWSEIASRYRRQPGAEARLVAVVLQGTKSGARHWSGRASGDAMLPNKVEVSEDEARAIVRWILR